MRFINYLMRSFLRRRYARLKQMQEQPVALQQQVFQQFIHKAQDTVWGKAHGYSKLKTLADFTRQVPLSQYDDLKPYIQRAMLGEANVLWPGQTKMFSKSSGTTSDKSKFLPVTAENLKLCHLQGGYDATTAWYEENPQSQLFTNSKGMIMGGSLQAFPQNPSALVGDVSALMVSNLPFYARPFLCPSVEVALLPNWDDKLTRLSRASIGENITNLSGVPTWTVLLFQEILRQTGKQNMLEVFPNFELYLHGGVSFEPYRSQFQHFFPGNQVQYREVYNASEGFFGVQLRKEEDMFLLLNNGVFFEFIPLSELDQEQPRSLSLAEVEVDQNYALVISTNAGLWRYLIGDTIKFTAVRPFHFRITGRTQQFINVFGEEVMVENTDKALARACAEHQALVREYTVAPRFLGNAGEKGGHEWLLEFEHPPQDLAAFAQSLDLALQAINSDYEAKRYKDMALDSLKLQALPAGTFMRWLSSKGKLGGQNKVPRLANHRRYVEEILSIMPLV